MSNLLVPGAGLDSMLKPATEGGLLFCPLKEEYAINGRKYQWPRGQLIRWHLGFSRLGQLGTTDLMQAGVETYAKFSAICKIKFEYTSNPKTANFLLTTAALDGPSGVLADMQVPMPGANERTQLVGRFDAEAYGIFDGPSPRGKIHFPLVLLHEGGHGIGSGHAPFDRNDPCVMEGTYNDSLRELQPRDIATFVERYGPPDAAEIPKSVPANGLPVYCSIGPKGLRFWQDGSKVWGIELPWKVDGEIKLTLPRLPK